MLKAYIIFCSFLNWCVIELQKNCLISIFIYYLGEFQKVLVVS